MEQQIDEKKKQKIKLNRMQWTIIIGLLVMVGVLVYALVKNNRVSASYEVVTSLSRGYVCLLSNYEKRHDPLQ